MNCSVCDESLSHMDIKYWVERPEGQYIFCGPECSLSFHRKENEKTNNNIEDFNNPNCDRTGSASS